MELEAAQPRKTHVALERPGPKFTIEEVKQILDAEWLDTEIVVADSISSARPIDFEGLGHLDNEDRKVVQRFLKEICQEFPKGIFVLDHKTYEERHARREQLTKKYGPEFLEAYKSYDKMRLNRNTNFQSASRALVRVLEKAGAKGARALRLAQLSDQVPEKKLERYTAMSDDEKRDVIKEMDAIALEYAQVLAPDITGAAASKAA